MVSRGDCALRALGFCVVTLGGCADLREVGATGPRATKLAEAVAAPVGSRAVPSQDPSPADRGAHSALRDDERTLRNAFAAANGDVEPALRLASFLVAGERHLEALHILDLTVAAERDRGVLLARASVLRDLCRNDEARRDLTEVVQRRGRAGVAAGTLFELAQVEWLAGGKAEARKTLNDLLRLHADSKFLGDHREHVREWHIRLERTGQTSGAGDLRDALALLRAAPVVTARLRMLDALAIPPTDAATRQGRRAVRAQAIAIACADSAAAVRARAVQLAVANEVIEPALWAAALQDPSALVRRCAAGLLADVGGETDALTLLSAMEAEPEAEVFEVMHQAMSTILKSRLLPCEASSPAGRARTVSQWRQRCAH